MIPKECKRLAEVDFPIAVVSKHSAREKSIWHGYPSTLHLWWSRRKIPWLFIKRSVPMRGPPYQLPAKDWIGSSITSYALARPAKVPAREQTEVARYYLNADAFLLPLLITELWPLCDTLEQNLQRANQEQ